jgi:hypothetical protein
LDIVPPNDRGLACAVRNGQARRADWRQDTHQDGGGSRSPGRRYSV